MAYQLCLYSLVPRHSLFIAVAQKIYEVPMCFHITVMWVKKNSMVIQVEKTPNVQSTLAFARGVFWDLHGHPDTTVACDFRCEAQSHMTPRHRRVGRDEEVGPCWGAGSG